jgi:nitroimidazol reductase NimA-like FMN-containing flavoprotein (pyridoxamine 5'-phosphate oxidase superfamily)
MNVLDRNGLVVIDAAECMRLLGSHHLGRLAVVVDGQPLVFPVNYALDGAQVVFRTGSGTKLHGADGRRVAFEIDGSDVTYHTGWSVVVVGTAFEEHDPLKVHELESLPLAPWGPGEKSHWMRIQRSAVTGRRIERLAD